MSHTIRHKKLVKKHLDFLDILFAVVTIIFGLYFLMISIILILYKHIKNEKYLKNIRKILVDINISVDPTLFSIFFYGFFALFLFIISFRFFHRIIKSN